ncbi:MAG: tRNA (guanosine(37)-N1)-methyltransferase TrmD [Lysobacterales bacterium CG_4_9_14_3_um_filter_62_6]|nr:MAG: tRNA (guanosine(37)-N1)-methyltransferase TrmD [Xanthomonadales bacterium CG_4_9_14_3_um_filter_62_6]
MRIDVVTLFPQFFAEATRIGVVGRAQERGLLSVVTWNPRDAASDLHRSVDDRTFGGGPGMVMTVEPLRSVLKQAQAAEATPAPVIYLSPQGERLTQRKVESLSQLPRMILLCGRYEGIDERLLDEIVDQELSIGDYVLSGGELAASVLIDAVGRLHDGALGDADSAKQDSFANGLLDCPHYSRSRRGGAQDQQTAGVPPVLLSGNHALIAQWRLKQSLGRTWLRRPDLLARMELDQAARKLLEAFRQEYLADHETARQGTSAAHMPKASQGQRS